MIVVEGIVKATHPFECGKDLMAKAASLSMEKPSSLWQPIGMGNHPPYRESHPHWMWQRFSYPLQKSLRKKLWQNFHGKVVVLAASPRGISKKFTYGRSHS